MKIAIVTLATNDYIIGAENLFYSIYKNIDERYIDFYYATDIPTESRIMSKIGAKNILLDNSYDQIKTNQNVFKEVSKKFFAFKMYEYGDYDRVIFFDSDMLCNGNIDFMFSYELNKYPFWAARDYGCIHYYPKEHKIAKLNFEKTFNSGSFIINKSILNKNFFEKLIYECRNELFSYDSGDQGYLNSFFLKNKMEIGLYDVIYNYALDANYPKRNFEDIRIIHFTGKKPWKVTSNEYSGNFFYDLWYSTRSEHKNFLYTIRNKKSIAGLKDLMYYIKNNSVGVEIGSFIGESSIIISEKCSKLYCVDPWDNNSVNNDMSIGLAEKIFDEKISGKKNIIKIKDFSLDFCGKISDKSLDFVYIDGLHDYNNVKKDIISWLPKIKLDGIICGHDYYEDFPGCIKAVNEIFVEPHIIFDDTSWLIFMKDNRIKISSSDELTHLYDETYYLGGFSEHQERFMGVDGWQEFQDGIISSKKIESINKIDFINKVIFDIGFGRGELLKYCNDNGAKKCFGIDYSAAAFDIANNFINNSEVKLFNESINNFNPSLISEKIDCIYMIDVLEHAQDHEWVSFFKKINILFSNNIVVYIETPTHQLNTGEYLGMHNNYTTIYYIKEIFKNFFNSIEIDRVDGWYNIKLYDKMQGE